MHVVPLDRECPSVSPNVSERRAGRGRALDVRRAKSSSANCKIRRNGRREIRYVVKFNVPRS